jgi:hypothetical protein
MKGAEDFGTLGLWDRLFGHVMQLRQIFHTSFVDKVIDKARDKAWVAVECPH